MLTVLIVEDNDLNRDMLERRLRRKGYAVLTANDGAEGIAVAREHRPDIVLMDLRMPGVNGWDATARLKSDPLTADLPVLALSAHALADEQAAAVEAGCDDYEVKPVELPRLLAKIERLTAHGRGAQGDRRAP